jgi:hypothetical protein
MNPAKLRSIERILAAAIGGMSMVLGYRLFPAMPAETRQLGLGAMAAARLDRLPRPGTARAPTYNSEGSSMTEHSRVRRAPIHFGADAGLAPTIAAAILAFVLSTAHPADAANHDKLLLGDYAEAGTATCLYASGGFDSSLQPNLPGSAVVTTESLQGVWTFNGAGSVSEDGTDIITSWLGSSTSGLVPNVTASTTTGARKYVVAATGGVTVTVTNGKWKITAGPRPGQTFTVDSIEFVGRASDDGATATLGTGTPAVETVTFSNGDVTSRICHRSIVLLTH